MTDQAASPRRLTETVAGLLGLLSLMVQADGFGELTLGAETSRRPYNEAMVDKLARQKQPAEFCFAVMGDVHGDYAAMGRTLEQMVPYAPRFCVQMGDLFGTDSSAKQFGAYVGSLRKAGIPILTVMGNHDVHGGARDRFNDFIGREDYSFDYGPARFIVLDTSRRWLSTKQLQWFRRCLATEKRKFVLTHEPPYLGDWWINAFHGGSDEFLRLCAENHVEHVFTAHLHVLDQAVYEGVPLTCVGVGGCKSPFAPLGVPFAGFVLVRVSDDGSEVEAIGLSAAAAKSPSSRPLGSHPLPPTTSKPTEAASRPSWARSGSGRFTVAGTQLLRGVGVERPSKEQNDERQRLMGGQRALAALQDEVERYVGDLMRDVMLAAGKYTDPEGPEALEYVHTVSKAVGYFCLQEARIEQTWTDPEDGTLYASQKCPLEKVWNQTAIAARRLAEAPRTPDMALTPGTVFGRHLDSAMRLVDNEIAKRRRQPSRSAGGAASDRR